VARGIRTYDRNERTVRIVVNCDILRDATHVLEGENHNRLAYRLDFACRGMHPMSDVDVEVFASELPEVERAVALVA